MALHRDPSPVVRDPPRPLRPLDRGCLHAFHTQDVGHLVRSGREPPVSAAWGIVLITVNVVSKDRVVARVDVVGVGAVDAEVVDGLVWCPVCGDSIDGDCIVGWGWELVSGFEVCGWYPSLFVLDPDGVFVSGNQIRNDVTIDKDLDGDFRTRSGDRALNTMG